MKFLFSNGRSPEAYRYVKSHRGNSGFQILNLTPGVCQFARGNFNGGCPEIEEKF